MQQNNITWPNDANKILLENYWHLVGHKSELKENLSYVKLKNFDHDIVLYNDYGDIVAFDNKCPHRGASFFSDKAGSSKMVCPYHAWTYQKGALYVSRPKEFSSCDISHASINKFKLNYCGDFIFYSVTPAVSLEEQLGVFFAELSEISHHIRARYEYDGYTFKSDWKIAVENALEPYHISLVHQETLAKLKLGAGDNYFAGKNSKWIAPVANVSRGTEKVLGMFNTGDRGRNYEFFYLFPFSMLSGTFGLSWSLQNFFPKGENESFFHSRLYGVNTYKTVPESIVASLYSSIALVNRQVFEEDHAICQTISSSTWSFLPPKYFSDAEVKLLKFRESCKSLL